MYIILQNYTRLERKHVYRCDGSCSFSRCLRNNYNLILCKFAGVIFLDASLSVMTVNLQWPACNL